MGMDLLARNKELDSFHFNWTGWRVLLDLLTQLQVDTSHLSGNNDGDKVPAETAREYANAIRSALEAKRIRVVKVKDSSFSGGYRETYEVRLAGCDLAKGEQTWLNEIADFFAQSSGFRQF